MPGKTLIVSLHDAHPGSQAAIAEQLAFLAGYGVKQTSILVVPDFHHGGPLAKNPTFCDAVTGWQDAGHEIVLHGYFHDRRESPRESLTTLFWTRLYTSREAEFLDLPPDEARVRLRRGRELFAEKGWNARGFIAPAWLMTPELPGLLAELGFSYTNRPARPYSAGPQKGSGANLLAVTLLQHAGVLASAGLRALEQATFRQIAGNKSRKAQPASARS